MKNMIKGFTGLMVGIPLIGAASEQVGNLGAGTAKTFAGTAVGLGSIALVGESMKMIPKSMKGGKMKW